MTRLTPDNGIPRHILLLMAALAGFTVANLYYNQPLLEMICKDTGITQVEANFITVFTQIGYALGLLFVIPIADMISLRRIVVVAMSVSTLSALMIGVTSSVWLLWGGSLLLGISSIMPQLFIPMATLYSQPQHKSRNMGYISSGIMTGIVSARAISGYVGDWIGWRGMFFIVAFLMVIGLVVSLRLLPEVTLSFHGSYIRLMRSVIKIFASHRRIRLYSFRPSLSFASMMAIWACMAFHLAQPPFEAGSDVVGLLGLCGVAGAIAASGIGRYVPRMGIPKMSVIGGVLQLTAWCIAWLFGDSYGGLISAIILADIGAQFLQISNQSGCLQEVPEATNRVNTIFMTTFFIGGSIGTFCAGIGWSQAGWSGVCLVGVCFTLTSLLFSAFERIGIVNSEKFKV